MKSEIENTKQLVSITTASKIFGLGRDFLYRRVKTDPTLPCIKVNGITKINVPLMKKWIDRATEEHREL